MVGHCSTMPQNRFCKKGYEYDVLYEYSYGYEKLKDHIKYFSEIAFCSLIYQDFSQNRKDIKHIESKATFIKKSKFHIYWLCETVLQLKSWNTVC